MAEGPARFADRMNESDATLWSIEADPALRTTIVAVLLLDRVPDWSRLRTRMAGAVDRVPRLRQRVVSSSLPAGTPQWVDDDRFDLDYHLRRVAAAPPATLRTVLDLAGIAAMAAFDKDRPLWEFTLVEGLADGGCALVEKVHHCFTDGVGGIRLAALVLDDDPAAPEPPHTPPTARPSRQSPVLAQSLRGVAEDVGSAVRAGSRIARQLPGFAGALALHPRGTTGAALGTGRSLVRLVAPVRTPLSPLWVHRGLSRRLDTFDLPLTALKAAAHHAGGTVNDAYLAGIAGAAYRYHERSGAKLTNLRVTMPVNLRRDDDPLGNNRFTPVRFTLPADIADPAARIRVIAELAHRQRAEPGLAYSDTVAGLLNRLPARATRAVLGSMLKSIDFVATNVAGFDHPVYLAGARVTRSYAFAPTSGSAFSVALLSHLDSCHIGVSADTAAIDQPCLLTTCLVESFDEILALRPATVRARTAHTNGGIRP